MLRLSLSDGSVQCRYMSICELVAFEIASIGTFEELLASAEEEAYCVPSNGIVLD